MSHEWIRPACLVLVGSLIVTGCGGEDAGDDIRSRHRQRNPGACPGDPSALNGLRNIHYRHSYRITC